MDRKLIIYLVFLFLLLLPSAVPAAPPIPARIGGTLTIDGEQLTQNTDAGFTIKLTRLNGTDFTPTVGDNDGLNASDWYVIDIPVYDANSQPDGATIGETAIIHVYKDSKEFTVISPSNGHIIVGNSGSTIRIDISVETPGKLDKAMSWLQLLSLE